MKMKSLSLGILAAAALATATPALSQSIEIGRDGIRLVEPESPREQRRERRQERREDRREAREIGERDAVRIARAEGLREVDEVTRTRRAYRVLGIDRRGDDIQVDIDRSSGAVLAVR